jgi:WD40 repeat protein
MPITSVAFSPDGKRLVSGSYVGTIQLWDVPAGKSTATLQNTPATLGPLSNSVYMVAFSPDGRSLAAASRDGTVKLWDVAKRRIETNPKRTHRTRLVRGFQPGR